MWVQKSSKVATKETGGQVTLDFFKIFFLSTRQAERWAPHLMLHCNKQQTLHRRFHPLRSHASQSRARDVSA
jgi:hypothetical protein